MKKSKSFSHSVVINAKRSVIYETLTNGAKFSKVTDAPAQICPIAGTAFVAYGGYLNGFVLDAKKSKYLVQAWRTKEWAPGDFSLLRFSLSDEGSSSTRIEIYHYGIPSYHESSNIKVWDEFYWSKLKAAYENSKK